MPDSVGQLAAVEHIVVLMLENRSFDHMLGYLYTGQNNVSPTGQPFEGLKGTESNPDGQGGSVTVFPIDGTAAGAYFMPGADPDEGYEATNKQLYGTPTPGSPLPAATNQGFLTDYTATLAQRQKQGRSVYPGTKASDIMGCFTPKALPVLSGLARGYAVCDHWFCSAPTETLPNRAFTCAGTSQGHMDDATHTFTTPSIFGRLSDHNIGWSIYGYDAQPLTRGNFPDTSQADASHFGLFTDFKTAAANGTLPAFAFLEPSWGSSGNSQHPNYDVALGEQLIHDVYEALRQGPGWNSTLLIITYDEHGGCYDHVAPPTGAVPPDASAGEFGFDFKRFGVRVPTVLVSPLIEAGSVFRVPDGTTPLDHTSILKTVEQRWGVPALTARDAAAPGIGAALTLTTPRTDDPLAGVTVPTSKSTNPALGETSHLAQVQADLVTRRLIPADGPAEEVTAAGGTSTKAASPKVALAGSERAPLAGARALGPVDDAEPVEVTLTLRRRAEIPTDLIEGPHTVTSRQLTARYGADPDDVHLVQRIAEEHGLRVVEAHASTRRVRLAGTLAQLRGVVEAQSLQWVESPDPHTGEPVRHRHREGVLRLSADVSDVVVGVLGLDGRPQARSQLRRHAEPTAATTTYTPPELGTVYRFPQGTDGSGETLAIIELGGGFTQSDLDKYFTGLSVKPTPSVVAAGVDGGSNSPQGDPNSADGEVCLDIEVAGALAPGAHQVVYFAPNTDQGFVDAVTTAVHATPTPAAVSISWGGSEDSWTAQGRNALNSALADAAALGVTVCVAAGDNGSSDGATDGTPHVDFPASSPYALACGGTRLNADATTGTVTSETVWNSNGSGTGGGISDVFPLPAWQSSAGVPTSPSGGTGRGVPDVAGDADPATGYQILVDGQQEVVGGTSAVAPLWAALTCRLVQALGHRLGLLQPLLYPGAAKGTTPAGFRDVTSGGNGAYNAAPGWDPCTGLGVPDGTALLNRLKSGNANPAK